MGESLTDLHSCCGKRAQISRKGLQDCGKEELKARKVKDGFESKLKGLVEPGNLFQVYCEWICDSKSRLLLVVVIIVIIHVTSHVYFSSIMKTIQ